MRRLVNFVRRSCAISLKPATRYNSSIEELKHHLRRFLGRDLTVREEHLLELSVPLLGSDLSESSKPEQENDPKAA